MILTPVAEAVRERGVYARWGYHMDDCPRGIERWTNWHTLDRLTQHPSAFVLQEILGQSLGEW